ncbi:MAG: hypothetical protein U1F08_01595 [Steroidobacteraceae bacterium]
MHAQTCHADSRPPALRLAMARVAIGCLASGVLAGCVSYKVDETRQVVATIQPNESIVLLKKPQLEGAGTESDFLSCVQENLGGELVHPHDGQSAKPSKAASVPFKIYGEQQFQDALYPWFEPSTAPANASGLKVLLQRPGITERLQQIGVRYVVWLDGNTVRKDGGGSVTCAIGPGVPACLGLGWWDKEADYVATVWDLQTATEIGEVNTDVTGTSVFIGAVAPIPIIVPVQGKACDRMSEQLRSFLTGGDLQVPVSGAPSSSGSGGGN